MSAPLRLREFTIVVSDICSSTTILETLSELAGGREKWILVLQGLQELLKRHQSKLQMEIYKFVGDGWILLFPPAANGKEIFKLLTDLSRTYQSLVQRHLAGALALPRHMGLTFGASIGSLIKFDLSNNTEYIGRSLNLACRLQGSIKQKLKHPPAYSVMCSRRFYEQYKSDLRHYESFPAMRSLRNIPNGKSYRARRYFLPVQA